MEFVRQLFTSTYLKSASQRIAIALMLCIMREIFSFSLRARSRSKLMRQNASMASDTAAAAVKHPMMTPICSGILSAIFKAVRVSAAYEETITISFEYLRISITPPDDVKAYMTKID